MFVTLVLSSALIVEFDLDSVDSNELTKLQKTVGYIILVLLSVNIASFAFSCG